MVLADMGRDEMAERLYVDVAVVEVWEQVYFDARDLRHAIDWVSIHIIHREQKAGNWELAAKLTFALAVGPMGVVLLYDTASLICRMKPNRCTSKSEGSC